MFHTTPPAPSPKYGRTPTPPLAVLLAEARAAIEDPARLTPETKAHLLADLAAVTPLAESADRMTAFWHGLQPAVPGVSSVEEWSKALLDYLPGLTEDAKTFAVDAVSRPEIPSEAIAPQGDDTTFLCQQCHKPYRYGDARGYQAGFRPDRPEAFCCKLCEHRFRRDGKELQVVAEIPGPSGTCEIGACDVEAAHAYRRQGLTAQRMAEAIRDTAAKLGLTPLANDTYVATPEQFRQITGMDPGLMPPGAMPIIVGKDSPLSGVFGDIISRMTQAPVGTPVGPDDSEVAQWERLLVAGDIEEGDVPRRVLDALLARRAQPVASGKPST